MMIKIRVRQPVLRANRFSCFGGCMSENRIISVALSAALFFMAMAACPLSCGALDEQTESREYTSQGNYFRCSVPRDWSEYQPGFGLSQEEKKVYGVTLFGPSDGGPVPPTISLHYYAPGNLLHRTMDKFIRTHSQPVLGPPSEGESHGEVHPVAIAGRQARTFERKNVRYTGGRSLNPGKVVLFERFVVIPDEDDRGFYVLSLSVSDEAGSRYAGIFKVVTESFRPGR
jgi:hypothetical protein